MEALIDQMPAGVETAISIVDLRGFTPSNHDFRFTRQIISITQDVYTGRSSLIAFCYAPAAFRHLWALISPHVDRRVGEQVRILGGASDCGSALLEHVDASTLQVDYGGERVEEYPPFAFQFD